MDQTERVYPGFDESFEPNFDDPEPFCNLCGEEDCDGECITYCCWDVRYRGPKDHCACADFQKQMELEQKWWYPIYLKAWSLTGKLRRLRLPVIRWRKNRELEDDELPF